MIAARDRAQLFIGTVLKPAVSPFSPQSTVKKQRREAQGTYYLRNRLLSNPDAASLSTPACRRVVSSLRFGSSRPERYRSEVRLLLDPTQPNLQGPIISCVIKH